MHKERPWLSSCNDAMLLQWPNVFHARFSTMQNSSMKVERSNIPTAEPFNCDSCQYFMDIECHEFFR